jgi:peroxidase
LYVSHEDVDLTVGGSLESHVSGALAGPTFLCILTEQFYRTRVGDRYWYEHGDETGFSREQLSEIRKASMARLFCDNGNNIEQMQRAAFVRVSNE